MGEEGFKILILKAHNLQFLPPVLHDAVQEVNAGNYDERKGTCRMLHMAGDGDGIGRVGGHKP